MNAQQIYQQMVEHLDGTCAFYCFESAVADAIINLSLNIRQDDFMSQCEEIDNNVHEYIEKMGLSEEGFWDVASQCELGECPACGWWATDCYYHHPDHETGVCSACEEE